MKPNPNLNELLSRAVERNVFGTKMRSVVKEPNEDGIKQVVDQQFEVAKEVIAAGLVPIIEPEVDINSANKEQIEAMLNDEILSHLDKLSDDEYVMLKLTIPSLANFYKELIDHPRVVRVVALSGGYPRE